MVISLEYQPRGNMHISLISPHNTVSVLLQPRPRDSNNPSFTEWPFMSVHFWGENPKGTWKLIIANNGVLKSAGPGKYQFKEFLLYINE